MQIDAWQIGRSLYPFRTHRRLQGTVLANKVEEKVKEYKGSFNSICHAQRMLHSVAPGYNLKRTHYFSFIVLSNTSESG